MTNDFNIPYTRYVDPEGVAISELPEFAKDTSRLIELYRHMTVARRFDTKAIALQRTGRIPTFPPALGQEATHVGLAAAMAVEDVLLPTYRDASAMLVRGVTLEELFFIMGGDERGFDYAGPVHDFPQATPIATQTAHAAGVAYAMKLRGEKNVAVTIIGDGGSSKGDFYEAMNFAGVWEAPVVFVVINNGWAISLPREKQSAAETLAQKGIAAGIPGEQVDGNDVIAVTEVVGRALERARKGEGPSVIEALTYRLTDHSTADDANRYRDADEVSEHWKAEPLLRMRNYLTAQELWSKEDEESLLVEVDAEINAAVDKFDQSDPQPPESMFDYLYAEVPADLAEQRQDAMARHASKGGAHG
ncbi:MAG: pyruvate dehydrogenase (acetyl-transferring) E1 component subunit alpha [Rhodospirillaceae bacterium]|jgi:2-oxoisovalerate dehydrogenase E1 component alpha subunit|nr:pyruvate dehydrogenase (acetyl-transferring) E1 component subunit alpha [Rhodospirillaceae bacterium]MBT4939194.1 pyruvate dehydrogenase (acetyl-transferring) E1 component subunit alpha [Rhodospirillaceae bacterium]MBT5938654.1 pyruvate dehydrogenase (acetyl-transferring) E1 component subunit alpha [Rhodospirillaceae bacterium]MBT7267119.1 pyruvate dehydrogenase (acetyl-transferring) E1 component subunit alpha [Rhodospirillaceae bacterium]